MSAQGNSSCLSSDLLEQLKAQLPESLFASVSGAMPVMKSSSIQSRTNFNMPG